MWREVLLSLFTGGLAGFIFGKLNLPVPAPPTLAGIVGIIGLAVGYTLAAKL